MPPLRRLAIPPGLAAAGLPRWFTLFGTSARGRPAGLLSAGVMPVRPLRVLLNLGVAARTSVSWGELGAAIDVRVALWFRAHQLPPFFPTGLDLFEDSPGSLVLLQAGAKAQNRGLARHTSSPSSTRAKATQ